MDLPQLLNDTPADLDTQFKAMNRAMALVLLEECYDVATADNAPFSAKIKLLELNVKLGELEPKQAVIAPGAGIQFVINLPATATTAAQTLTIDSTAQPEDAAFSIDLMPPRPEFLPALSEVVFPDD